MRSAAAPLTVNPRRGDRTPVGIARGFSRGLATWRLRRLEGDTLLLLNAGRAVQARFESAAA